MSARVPCESWPGIERLGAATPQVTPAGAYRTQSLEQTFRRVWPLRARAGVTRVADVTDLDHLGIPVAVATRAAARSLQNTSCQGAGPKYEAAVTAALMEAVERHSAARSAPLLLADVGSLREQRRVHVSLEEMGAAPVDSSPIEWIESLSLRAGQPAWIPAAEVLFPYLPPPGVVRPVRPSTSGLASGNTLVEAAVHALFEVIERDAVSRFLAGAVCPALDLQSVDSPDEEQLLDKLQNAGIELLVVDLGACSVLPAFKVYAIDKTSPHAHLAVSGQGAHVSPALAVRRALYEVVQSRVVAIQGSREDLARHQTGWSEDYEAALARFNLLGAVARSQGMVRLNAEPCVSSTDLKSLLFALCERLARAGRTDVLCTDLTDPEIGIPTVHVCVPGLVDGIVEPTRRRCALESW